MTLGKETSCPFCCEKGTLRKVCEDCLFDSGLPVSCLSCGGAYFHKDVSDPGDDEYWEGDPVNEQVYTVPEVRRAFTKKYDRYLDLLDRNQKANGKSLLEVGCGSGIFLEAAAKRGWKVGGLDISKQAVDLVQRFLPEAKVVCSPLDQAGYREDTFDLIALWDVIEHVDTPDSMLRQVNSLLRPGGTLIMETPDEKCLARRLVRVLNQASMGRANFLSKLYYPAHKWYFSRQSMSILLRSAGFDHIVFYREQTVRQLRNRKTILYGMRNTWSQRLSESFADVMGIIPWLRNKMVVLATKQAHL